MDISDIGITIKDLEINKEKQEYLKNIAKVIWTKYIFGDREFVSEIKFIENGLKEFPVVRVKYLDREDIESLGWITKDNLYIINDNSDGSTFVLHQLNQITFGIHNEGSTRFIGTIKNKSELKKLMLQLGINNESI